MPIHDVNGRRIAWAGAAIVLGVAFSVLAVLVLLRHWNMPDRADRARLGYDLVIEGAGLQSAPQLDLARYHSQKQRILESMGWVDEPRGIVHIPLATAMALAAQSASSAASATQGRP